MSSSERLDRPLLISLGLLVLAVLVFAVVRAALSGGVVLEGRRVAEQVSDLLAFAALCALLSSATVELGKRLTPARGWLQQIVFDEWLRQRAEVTEADRRRASDQLARCMLAEPLDEKAEPGHERRTLPSTVFDLPPDLLVARIAAAADAAVVEPWEAVDLLRLLTGRWPEKDPEVAASPVNPVASKRGRAELADAQRVQSTLDGLQVELAVRWRRIVQLAAVLVAGLYGIGLGYAGGLTGTGSARYILVAVALGGPGAWVVRDLTAILERLRA